MSGLEFIVVFSIAMLVGILIGNDLKISNKKYFRDQLRKRIDKLMCEVKMYKIGRQIEKDEVEEIIFRGMSKNDWDKIK